MGRFPRNAPCPCGSGRKFKLCCGTTRSEERELARRLDVLGAATTLPYLFPLARPIGDEFDVWAERAIACGAISGDEPSEGLLDEAVAAIATERERIVAFARDAVGDAWAALAADAPEAQIEDAVLTGAAAAGMRERLEPFDRRGVALVEEGLLEPEGPVDLLSFTVDARDVWSGLEAEQLEAALASIPDDEYDDEDPAYDEAWNSTVAEFVLERFTLVHAQRLDVLVSLNRRRLPLEGFETASAQIELACDAYTSAMHRPLATLLAQELI